MSNALEGYKYGHKYSHKNKPDTRNYDRVHFTVLNNYLMKANIRDCLVETLGLPMSKLLSVSRTEENLNIICRPSQFARFVILRHVKYGEPNNMACLNMRLVLPEIPSKTIDVSQNPNTAGYTDTDTTTQVRRCNT